MSLRRFAKVVAWSNRTIDLTAGPEAHSAQSGRKRLVPRLREISIAMTRFLNSAKASKCYPLHPDGTISGLREERIFRHEHNDDGPPSVQRCGRFAL